MSRMCLCYYFIVSTELNNINSKIDRLPVRSIEVQEHERGIKNKKHTIRNLSITTKSFI